MAAPAVAGSARPTGGSSDTAAGLDGGTGWAAGFIIALLAAASAACIAIAVRRRRWDLLEPETAGSLLEAASEPLSGAPAPAPVSSPAEQAEAHLPRWLRPSVAAARVESLRKPRPTDEREPLAFDAPVDGVAAEVAERSVVRYDAVQLLDRPDEVLGRQHEELGSGDEVEIVERDGVWVSVRTPTGAVGWVPAMTLVSAGDLAAEAEEAAAREAAMDGIAEREQQDAPTLESLLAAAAARRSWFSSWITGESPDASEPPADPPPASSPARMRKIGKTKRRRLWGAKPL